MPLSPVLDPAHPGPARREPLAAPADQGTDGCPLGAK